MTGKNKTPLLGWHPRSAGLATWIQAEVQRRGGGRGGLADILDEALTEYRDRTERRRGQEETPHDQTPL